ncbi:MAG: glycoside hydrolase family 9 protein [Lachnospiraceae bacterium]|nr:glycoside hydrolase family 9 protein [Lachnospiraceae bacterium]
MKKGCIQNKVIIKAPAVFVVFLIFPVLFTLTGCRDKGGQVSEADPVKSRDEMLSDIESTLLGYNEEQEPEPEESVPELSVVLNNTGYEQKSDKELVLIVSVSGEDIQNEEASFSVFDKKSPDYPVFSGDLHVIDGISFSSGHAPEAGKETHPDDDETENYESVKYFCGDFSGFFKEGEYFITCYYGDCSCESNSFKIEKNHYRTLIAMQSLLASKEESPYDFMRIADLLLEYEFFDKELTGEGQENFVPVSLDTARILTEKLCEYVDNAKESGEEAISGSADNYRLAAILSKLSACYSGTDWEASKGWKKRAVALFKTAEGEYREELAAKEEEQSLKESTDRGPEDQAADSSEDISDISEDENHFGEEELYISRSARYWAAAELYDLTGEKGYRRIAEEEASEEIPSGFSDRMTGDLGSIAYLTCGKKTDRALSDRLMESIYKRAVEASEIKAEERLSAYDEEETKAYIQKELETARLCMFANLASQSTQFVKRTEKAVDYLYGLNPEGKAFAQENKDMPVFFVLSGLANSYIAQ